MPSVMSHMGIMLGVVLILWSGVTAAFGLYLQSKCARYLDRGSSSFFALSQITYPGASVIFDLAIAVKCFGVGVSYMIIIGDLMPGVMLGFNDRAAEIPYLVDRHFWITAFMLLVIPLSFLRRLDSLKYTSIVALVSIGYLIVLVVYHFAADPHADPKDIRVIQWASAAETLSALPVVVFAYTCHQNVRLPRHIYHDPANALPDVLHYQRNQGQLSAGHGWGGGLQHWFGGLHLRAGRNYWVHYLRQCNRRKHCLHV